MHRPYEEDNVGFNITISTIDYLHSFGIPVKSKFWDAARKAKSETDLSHGNLNMRLGLQYVHDNIYKTLKRMDLKIRQSTIGDFNISNLGKYPFALEHKIVGTDQVITIDSLHLYNNMPGLGPSMVLFFATVNAMGYTMGHRLPEDTANEFFGTLVRIVESVGTFDSLVTVLDVAKMIIEV